MALKTGSDSVLGSEFRGRRGAVALTFVSLLALFALVVAPSVADATNGPSNNFGSDRTAPDSSNIHLNDGRYVDWSIHWGYIGGWTLAQIAAFQNIASAGMEYYEPTDLQVTRGADGSTQDVAVVPVNGSPNLVAVAACRVGLPGLTIYGSHHHRVCDRKQITVYNGSWGYPLATVVYNIMAHEAGHAVGLRHSNAPCPGIDAYCRGVSSNGTPQWNTHAAPGTDSLMWQGLGTPASTSLNLQDVGNIQMHY